MGEIYWAETAGTPGCFGTKEQFPTKKVFKLNLLKKLIKIYGAVSGLVYLLQCHTVEVISAL